MSIQSPIPHSDTHSLAEWARTRTTWDEVEAALQIDVPHVSVIVLQNAPGHLIDVPFVSALLNRSTNLSPRLLAISRNPSLEPSLVELLSLWARDAMFDFRSKDTKRAVFSSDEGILRLLRNLELAGHRLPAGLMDPVLQRIRAAAKEDKTCLPHLGHFVLERWFDLRAEDAGSIYQAVKGVSRLVERLVGHPAVSTELLRTIAHDHAGNRVVAKALLARAEAANDEQVRAALLRSRNNPVLSEMLPTANSKEFVYIAKRVFAEAGTSSLRVLQQRAPAPEEFADVFRHLAFVHPERAVYLLETDGISPWMTAVTPGDMAVLLKNAATSELRLRAQAAWSAIQAPPDIKLNEGTLPSEPERPAQRRPRT